MTYGDPMDQTHKEPEMDYSEIHKRRIEWLASLKPGDVVALSASSWSDDTLAKVVRVTPAQIIVAGNLRFWKRDGEAVGGSGYTRSSIHEATDEIRAACWKRSAVNTLRNLRWDKLPEATIRAVLELLP